MYPCEKRSMRNPMNATKNEMVIETPSSMKENIPIPLKLRGENMIRGELFRKNMGMFMDDVRRVAMLKANA